MMRLLRLVIECATPLHCGGGIDEIQDSPVTRDAFGYWRIPGTSLAGSLRALSEQIDPGMADRIFGCQTGDKSVPSLIWCEDGLLLDYDGKPALEKLLAGEKPQIEAGRHVRDHVCIDLDTGATDSKGGKYDVEIVPAGARFLLEFRCDGWNRELDVSEAAHFDKLCALILGGNLSLGGLSSIGYGLYRVIRHEYREIKLKDNPAGLAAWMTLPDFGLPGPEIGEQLPLAPAESVAGSGLDGWLELPLACTGPVLIGGGAPGPASEADMLFALTPQIFYDEKTHLRKEPVLPGSSIRGVIRHAVYDILKDLGCRRSKELLEDLFGAVEAGEARCGKLIVTDAKLESSQPHFQFEQHVALDRFSGGALEGALFSEEPFWSKDAKVTLRIRACQLNAAQAALLFHALFDLLEGSLAIGSGVNRGNGRLALAGWRENPAAAAAAVRGNMAWNGAPVWDAGLVTLKKLAQDWDSALEAAL